MKSIVSSQVIRHIEFKTVAFLLKMSDIGESIYGNLYQYLCVCTVYLEF